MRVIVAKQMATSWLAGSVRSRGRSGEAAMRAARTPTSAPARAQVPEQSPDP